MSALRALLILSLSVAVQSACPNGCSGHGSCGNDDICTCYQDWLSVDTVKANGGRGGGGGDCSQMKCPYEIAWVDSPSSENAAHALAECAGRGICDRSTGDCQCFDGYTGKGCRRTTCPNDCSGHGTCEYLAELRNDIGDGFKYTGNQPTTDQYAFQFPLLWDAYKTRACVCDPKWTDVDCSRRMCPKGNYALYAHTEPKPEVQAIIISKVFTPDTDRTHKVSDESTADATDKVDVGYKETSLSSATNGEFALTFRSTLGEEFTTPTLNVYNLTEADVEAALNSLPNRVVEDAEVTLYRNVSRFHKDVYAKYQKEEDAWNLKKEIRQKAEFPYSPEYNYTWYANDLVILVTYAGAMTTGNQYALECKTAYCADGCQPLMMKPLDFKTGASCEVKNNFEDSYGVNIECAGRGSCDYATGICSCYQGYTDEYCSTQTALI